MLMNCLAVWRTGFLTTLSILFIFTESVQALEIDVRIPWKLYTPKYLRPELRRQYPISESAYLKVPLDHFEKTDQGNHINDQHFTIYVRKFAARTRTSKHVWFITGGPGGSTSGVEKAMSVLLDDTTIYLMDHRGLGKSQKLCKSDQSKYCSNNPEKCLKSLEYPTSAIALHNVAADYNFVSRLIKAEHSDAEIFMYGTSYGSMLAYRSFQLDPHLYGGLLLEAFMPTFTLDHTADVRNHIVDACLSNKSCLEQLPAERNNRIGLLSVMKEINSGLEKMENPCLAALSYVSDYSGYESSIFLGILARSMISFTSEYRTLLLPFLIQLRECPNPQRFFQLLWKLTAFKSPVIDSNERDEGQSGLALHASHIQKLNYFLNKLIRFSEYTGDSEELWKRCKVARKGFFQSRGGGKIYADNFVDPCEMIHDYRQDFASFLYKPKILNNSHSQSKTRIIVVNGKWDTQTLHDLALNEFKRMNVKEKYFFSADHLAHGVIDADPQRLLGLTIFLELMMTGRGAGNLRRLFDQVNKESLPWKKSAETQMFWDFTRAQMRPKSAKIILFSATLTILSVIPLATWTLLNIL